MYRALLYKEWLKTRRVFYAAIIISVIMAVYAILNMNSVIETFGVGSLWLNMIQKDGSMVSILTYLPLITGLAMGIAQMTPEMSHKRLKLTLHLPYPTNKLVLLMLATGLLQLLVIFAVQLLIIVIYDAQIIPAHLVSRVVLTTLPWYVAGFCAYMFAAAVCLEGTWFMRIIISLLGCGVLLILFKRDDAMAAYNSMLILFPVLFIIPTILSLGSIYRFKEGLQD